MQAVQASDDQTSVPELGETFNRAIWDAFSDSGFIVLVCLKLEAVLTELLARFCNVTSGDPVMAYMTKYSHNKSKHNVLREIAARQYSTSLKNRCKMTFGNLIYEVFDNKNPDDTDGEQQSEEQQLGTPADCFGVNINEKEKFTEINRLRSKIAHYGKDTDGSKILRLGPGERERILSFYTFIVRESITFKQAYPDNADEVRSIGAKYYIESLSNAV